MAKRLHHLITTKCEINDAEGGPLLPGISFDDDVVGDENIIEDGINDFFFTHLIKLNESWLNPIHFAGSIAYAFKDTIKQLAAAYELEIGQISGLIHDIQPVSKIIESILTEFQLAQKESLQWVF